MVVRMPVDVAQECARLGPPTTLRLKQVAGGMMTVHVR